MADEMSLFEAPFAPRAASLAPCVRTYALRASPISTYAATHRAIFCIEGYIRLYGSMLASEHVGRSARPSIGEARPPSAPVPPRVATQPFRTHSPRQASRQSPSSLTMNSAVASHFTAFGQVAGPRRCSIHSELGKWVLPATVQ